MRPPLVGNKELSLGILGNFLKGFCHVEVSLLNLVGFVAHIAW